MNKLFVVLPCYNESENLLELIHKWTGQYEKISKLKISKINIVIVDDGSKDFNIVFENKLKNTNNHIHIIKHKKNQGLGAAIKTGLKYVINSSDMYDFVCIMDSDNTHNPAYIRSMIKKLNKTNSDCVIASRFQNKAEVRGVPFNRKLLSFGAKFVYETVLNVPNVNDYTCGYRLYKTSIIKDLYAIFSEDFIEENGFTCMVELLYKLYLTGAKFEEVAFRLRYDYKKGNSKMKIIKTSIKSLFISLSLKRAQIKMVQKVNQYKFKEQ